LTVLSHPRLRSVSDWFVPRKEKITAKGKGELQTYWLTRLVSDDDNRSTSTPSVQSAPVETVDEVAPNAAQVKQEEQAATQEQTVVDAKIARLVDWNVDVLNRLLGLIVSPAFFLHLPLLSAPEVFSRCRYRLFQGCTTIEARKIFAPDRACHPSAWTNFS
jgi:hypothetical protein